MSRYVKRTMGRREFGCWLDCTDDAMRPPGENVPEERVVEARIAYYQRKLVDAMLKILYLERLSLRVKSA